MDALGGNSLFEPVAEVVDNVLFENPSSGSEESEGNGAGKQEAGGDLDLGFELPDLGNPGLNRKLEKAIEDVLEETGTITQE